MSKWTYNVTKMSDKILEQQFFYFLHVVMMFELLHITVLMF